MISKKTQALINDDKKYLFQNYGDRLPACFTKGDGSYLFDVDGKKYIDFFAGIAVSVLGYSHKALAKALHNQVDGILHTSNWFLNKEQIEAAKLLSELAFPGKSLFVNSGTEANEAALKLARKYGQSISPEKYQIISFTGSFHGRTFGGLSATAQEKIRTGFGPILPGFKYLPLNDIDTFKKELEANKNICAIITELVQGEGGIKIADKKFISEVFDLCKTNNILTIIDEVQTGIGRTGKNFAYQHYGIKPDIITMAKGLGGGVPVGAIHAKDNVAQLFTKGVHGSTFGGNHLVVAAVVCVLKELKKGAVIKNTQKISEYIFSQLNALKKKVSFIKDIRGMGLHIGIELDINGFELVKKAMQMGLIINCTSDKVIRIMPPLTISMKTAKEGMALFENLMIEEQKHLENSKN